MPDFKTYQEYISLRSIHGSTKGTNIFREFQVTLLETQLDPSKLFAMVTDGCPSMFGANQGLINKWREENDLAPVTWHHCILNRESLAAKSLDMFNVMRVVISTVNWIGANALNHRKFKKFLANVDADYGNLVMFTAVRWLCRATCLKRFCDLIPEILNICQRKEGHPSAWQRRIDC